MYETKIVWSPVRDRNSDHTYGAYEAIKQLV